MKDFRSKGTSDTHATRVAYLLRRLETLVVLHGGQPVYMDMNKWTNELNGRIFIPAVETGQNIALFVLPKEAPAVRRFQLILHEVAQIQLEHTDQTPEAVNQLEAELVVREVCKHFGVDLDAIDGGWSLNAVRTHSDAIRDLNYVKIERVAEMLSDELERMEQVVPREAAWVS